MRKIIGCVIIFTALFHCFTAQEVVAQVSYSESIKNFNSTVSILKDGTITVSEQIIYDFGSAERHGIYRDIPYIKKNEDGKKFRMSFKVQSVTDEQNNSWNYILSDNGERIHLKIGDKDKYVTGIQHYIITYSISGALSYFSDHDEIYWNATGNDWNVPVEKSDVTVSVPTATPYLNVKCFTGPLGSTEENCTINTIGNIARFSRDQPLLPGSGLTIVVGFPKSVVAVLEPQEVADFFDTLLGKIALFALVISGLFWYFIYPLWLPVRWYLHGRDPFAGIPTRAWFEPPHTKNERSLTPGETGALIDEKVDLSDIQAIIVDLARRRYLMIVEYKKGEFKLVKHEDMAARQVATLTSFEKYFFEELFDGEDEVKLKDGKLSDMVVKTKEMIYESLVKEGFFPEDPSKVRKFYVIITGLAVFTINPLLIVTSVIFGSIMAKKTLEGAHAVNVAKGLKNFLSSQERQLKFQAEKQTMFEKLLPYAVAFGVEKIWAKRFEGLGLQQPEWYQTYGTSIFTMNSFSNSFHSSMSSVGKAATPTRSSSGFSSGFSGGSSGGGGGGGGGGSW